MAKERTCGEGDETASAPECSPESHERMKWLPVWSMLHLVGIQDDGDGGKLELRNCHCGTTLCKPVVEAPKETSHVVTVTLDLVDAMAFAQTVRALAREQRTPLYVRPLFAKVGQQILSAARLEMAQNTAVR